MNDQELRDVIERPVLMRHCRFEPGLVDLLLDDVRKQPGNLPQLQFCLKEMWQRKEGNEFKLKVYRDIGGMEGSLEQDEAQCRRRRKRWLVGSMIVALLSLSLSVAIVGVLWDAAQQSANEKIEAAARAETERGVYLALGKARELRERAEKMPLDDPRQAKLAFKVWSQCRAAIAEAERAVAAGGVDERLRCQVDQERQAVEPAIDAAKQDARLLAELDTARTLGTNVKDSRLDYGDSIRHYQKAFADYGIEVAVQSRKWWLLRFAAPGRE